MSVYRGGSRNLRKGGRSPFTPLSFLSFHFPFSLPSPPLRSSPLKPAIEGLGSAVSENEFGAL